MTMVRCGERKGKCVWDLMARATRLGRDSAAWSTPTHAWHGTPKQAQGEHPRPLPPFVLERASERAVAVAVRWCLAVGRVA